jgi:aminocarboxymuconate-semialdehyde decarboxylase
MPVIDVHTHMLNRQWLALLRERGAPKYTVSRSLEGQETILSEGAQFLTPMPAHLDYELRLKHMDEARVDVAIVSLTAPNVFFGNAEVSTAAARLVNDDMAQAQKMWPDRIRWLASLPWEHPAAAVEELKRAHRNGAVGVMVLANINGRPLTEQAFAPVWQAIDALALPVLVHPTTPPGAGQMQLNEFMLASAVGFMFDTTLAIARMIFAGFFDAYPNLKIIASHAGAALPYIIGRFDRMHEMRAAARTGIKDKPSSYMRRIYYDAVTYRLDALNLCLDIGGPDKLMYGSDFPHNIGDMKGCLARVDALPADHVKAVRSGNAERIFKL